MMYSASMDWSMERGNRVWCPKVLKKKKGCALEPSPERKCFLRFLFRRKKNLKSTKYLGLFFSGDVTIYHIFHLNESKSKGRRPYNHPWCFLLYCCSRLAFLSFRVSVALLLPPQRPKSCKALLPELWAGITNGIKIYKIERHKKQQSKNSSHIRN